MNQVRKTITLNELLASSDYYGAGMSVRMKIIDEEHDFTFIKHSFFEEYHLRKGTINSAAYFIRKCSTGQIYIGSSGHIRDRLIHHRASLLIGKNPAKNLQAVFHHNQKTLFDVCVIFTSDREQAFDVEQLLLDMHCADEGLLNVAMNSRIPMIGRIFSEETKRKISEGNLGKKLSAEAIQKIQLSRAGYSHSDETKSKISVSNSGKTRSSEHIAWLKINNHKRYRPVCINDVDYAGVRVAGRLLNIDNNTLINRIRSNSDTYKGYVYVS